MKKGPLGWKRKKRKPRLEARRPRLSRFSLPLPLLIVDLSVDLRTACPGTLSLPVDDFVLSFFDEGEVSLSSPSHDGQDLHEFVSERRPSLMALLWFPL